MKGPGGFRLAREPLRHDFEYRCAYCMIHEAEGNGPEAFEIDHFHPMSKGGAPAQYDNLFWSCRPCNMLKGDQWPTPAMVATGIRFANPCVELDYGDHMLENVDSGDLIPTTPCGSYHVDALRLNRDRLKELRRKRTEKHQELQSVTDVLDDLREQNPDSARRAVLEIVNLIAVALRRDLESKIPVLHHRDSA